MSCKSVHRTHRKMGAWNTRKREGAAKQGILSHKLSIKLFFVTRHCAAAAQRNLRIGALQNL